MKSSNRRSKIILKYFVRYLMLFILLIIVSAILNMNTQKQTINLDVDLNNIKSFGIIICKNSLVFMYIFSSLFIGRLNIYVMLISNALRIGLLISSFKYPIYMLMLLPHGIFEFFVFILLSAYISAHIYLKEEDKIFIFKKSAMLYILLIICAIIEAWVTPYLVFKFC